MRARTTGERAAMLMLPHVDANLYHDMISGRSVTGIMHLASKTVIDVYSKMQSTVETATFASAYVAARTCTHVLYYDIQKEPRKRTLCNIVKLSCIFCY